MSNSVSRDDKTPIPSLGSTNQTEKMENSEEKEPAASHTSALTYPSIQKRILIMVALYLAMFLVTLVQIPRFPVELLTCQFGLLI
jgi:hypothetical protein